MDTKILIDGSNAWYRAYTATPHLDQPGAAVSIMTYMLRRTCHQYGKTNVVVCWDAGHGGRKEIDPSYKSDRVAVKGVWEDLPQMKRMTTCLGIPTAKKEGFEADDVVGSLAVQTSDPVLILSYDKDFYQLVDGRIRVFRPARKIGGKQIPDQFIDVNEVQEEFECLPSKVILSKSFKGDNSDNIAKLPVRFTKNFKLEFNRLIEASEDVKDVYKNLIMIDLKYHEVFHAFKQQALKNERVIRILTDISVRVDAPEIDPEAFEELCNELRITRLKISDWQQMPTEAAPPPPVQRGLF